MTEQKTLVAFLLDRTGSMESIKAQTIKAFNAYVKGLAGTPGLLFSLVQFDTVSTEIVYADADPATVEPRTAKNYQPRASTPLIDAACELIFAVDRKVQPGDKVVICIQTDGEENSSVVHTWDELNALIKARSAAGWQFNFMGANIDAYQQAARMGLSVSQTVSYDANDRRANSAAFAAAARNTSGFASGDLGDTSFSPSQKEAAGDRYRPEARRRPRPDRPAPIVDDIDLKPGQPVQKSLNL